VFDLFGFCSLVIAQKDSIASNYQCLEFSSPVCRNSWLSTRDPIFRFYLPAEAFVYHYSLKLFDKPPFKVSVFCSSANDQLYRRYT
jgi:hypothetical protein